jgi:hypothetical protein
MRVGLHTFPEPTRIPPMPFTADPQSRTDLSRGYLEQRNTAADARLERQRQVIKAARRAGYDDGHKDGWWAGAKAGALFALPIGCVLVAGALWIGRHLVG